MMMPILGIYWEPMMSTKGNAIENESVGHVVGKREFRYLETSFLHKKVICQSDQKEMLNL
jgi:hypothetical protein